MGSEADADATGTTWQTKGKIPNESPTEELGSAG